jgi:glyoxylase-like metal-dependent hydrolase (beta-lactamase superfamily II)
VLTTHVHWDHIGGHGLFDRIAVHEAEKNWIDGGFPLPLNEVKEQLTKPPCTLPE